MLDPSTVRSTTLAGVGRVGTVLLLPMLVPAELALLKLTRRRLDLRYGRRAIRSAAFLVGLGAWVYASYGPIYQYGTRKPSQTGRTDSGRTWRALLPLASGSFLRLEVVIVGLDEGLNVLSHREKSKPLLFVQGHGESAHPVDGQGALLADLHSEFGVAGLSQALVFGSQALNLGLLI